MEKSKEEVNIYKTLTEEALSAALKELMEKEYDSQERDGRAWVIYTQDIELVEKSDEAMKEAAKDWKYEE